MKTTLLILSCALLGACTTPDAPSSAGDSVRGASPWQPVYSSRRVWDKALPESTDDPAAPNGLRPGARPLWHE